MADSNRDAKRKEARESANGSSLTLVARLVMLLLAAGLIVSVCMNVYVMAENVAIKNSNRDLARRTQTTDVLYQFTQRLVAELGVLSRTDAQAAELLRKHATPIMQLGLDSQARPLQPME